MIFYLFFAVMGGTAVVFGLPCGIIAGIRAAGDVAGSSVAFKAGMRWVFVCYLLFAVVAFCVTQYYGYLTSPDTYEFPRVSWIAWSTFLFLFGSFLVWMPVYSLSFFVTRGLAG